MHNLSILLAGAVLLAAGTPASADTRKIDERAQVKLAQAIEGRVPGKPVDCINLRDIQSTEIIDRTAIVYHMLGRTVYVNRLRGGSPSLDDDDILVTDTHSSQLCSIDIVRLLDRTSHFPNGFVNLGQFEPYTKPRPRKD